MQQIHTSIADEQMFGVETPAPPCGLVVFGASGDLAKRKLIPAIANLFKRGLVPEDFFFLGCGRKKFSDDDFRKEAADAISGILPDPEKFLNGFYYIAGDYGDKAFYGDIKKWLSGRGNKEGLPRRQAAGTIFYLSLPPQLYPDVVENLGQAGLNKTENNGFIRLVVEKPFGRDLQSAVALNDILSKWFKEEQIYRMDHYLGKETVQNILMFRFANSIFEPVWSRNYIDHIQMTIAESIGIEGRGGYYDKSGALRDMFVNHILSMLSLVAMEPPASFNAEHIRDEKVKLLRCIRQFNFQPWNEDIIRGQYAQGEIDGKKTIAYRQEPDVDKNSKTETFIAARLFVDNWRWQDVPFYLRTGKRLAKRVTEIAVTFKKVPHLLFASAGIKDLPSNVLIMKIQPQEGISLFFEAKRPGSKLCFGTLKMDFNYTEIFGSEPPDAYQRLLLDCMVGDQTLFTRIDDVKLAWGLVDDLLNIWQKTDNDPYFYPAGCESFSAADALIQKDGRNWRQI